MKITAFIADLSKGGAQGVFVTVVNYLYNHGYEVEIVTQNLEDAIHQKNINADIKITSLEVGSAKELLSPLVHFLKENTVEKALVFSPEFAVFLYWAKKITKKEFPICARCINTLSYEYKHAESFFRKYVTHLFVKIFYSKVDKAIAQSQGMGEDLIKNYGFKKQQVHVINNSLAVKFEKELLAKENIVKEDYILFAGRLEKQKGLEMLLDAFSKLNNNVIKLRIVGTGSQREYLEQLAIEKGIKERVEFMDYTEDIQKLYKNAKITVLSSLFEGFPNVLVESIACGTPVVSFDMPSGARDIIVEGENGYLVEYLNVEKFANAVDMALEKEWNYDTVKQTVHRFRQEIIMRQYTELLEKYV